MVVLDDEILWRDARLLELPRFNGLMRDIVLDSVTRLRSVNAFPDDVQIVMVGPTELAQVLN